MALQDESGNATSTRPTATPDGVNMSVWENVESLEKYVWQTVHKRFYSQRHEWFEKMDESYFVMWWVPAGHRRPCGSDRAARASEDNGASDHAFGWESLASAQMWKTARCA